MADLVELKGKAGRTICKMQNCQGLLVPELLAKGREERIQKLQTMKAKEGDVIIANFPKTGTHWLLGSIEMLKRGKAEVVHLLGVEGFLDAIDDLDRLEQEGSSRLLFTHMLPRHLSKDFREKSKFIICLRNPKDTAVSGFYTLKSVPNRQYQATWDEHFDLFFTGKGPPCSFFEYYRQWQEFALSHKKQVLVLYYEDMHKDYRRELRRLADFMDLHVSGETIAAIAEKGQFKSMTEELKSDQKIMEFSKRLNADGNLPFYRKGIVGDWKNHFTVAQNELADQVIVKEMEGSVFHFDFTV